MSLITFQTDNGKTVTIDGSHFGEVVEETRDGIAVVVVKHATDSGVEWIADGAETAVGLRAKIAAARAAAVVP